MTSRLLKTAAMCLTLAASPAVATPQEQINATLGADARLWAGLTAIALANELVENCPTLEARMLRATSRVYDLYSHARTYGYSRAEIQAFQRDTAVQARMRREILAYFARNNVREGVSETYCALGRSEIAAGTQAGELMRAR